MPNPTILDLLQLNAPQQTAATASGALVVTAGAGSGKTRTLVGRYLALLEAGTPLRAIVAITFTDKAAREMRTRIRQAVARWLGSDPPRRAFWEETFAGLDAARIGTIHSLCAQILRAHPVEAARLGLLPGFAVIEEGHAAVLRARAVEDALAWAAADLDASRLFGLLSESGLRRAVGTLLDRRLDAAGAFARLGSDPLDAWSAALEAYLAAQLDGPDGSDSDGGGWQGPLEELAALQPLDPADPMALARQAVLDHAAGLQAARRERDWARALAALAALHAVTSLGGRKANWPGNTLETARSAMRALRARCDGPLKPLADPKRPVDWALDRQLAGTLGALQSTAGRALDLYAEARRAENGCDFDDLEAGALALLREPAVRAFWQSSVDAVMVDEFQDTNERQRRIVYALAGFPAPEAPCAPLLFVVGDAKQSIYRFRGADVTVFRTVQTDVARAGGQVIPLDLTFRAHRALVETTNRLLAPIMGEADQPGRPYLVPFAPLQAHRVVPRPGSAAPFVELLLGLGENEALGRQAAAAGLATRLNELQAQEGMGWQDVALLFRASTAFPVYEDALERAAIPFVTVAGRGFYDRPEVRALLNTLQAAADPGDDLALVGFLRSPVVGLSDAALYRLRFPPQEIVPREGRTCCALWPVLNHPDLPEIVPATELDATIRGRDWLQTLHALSGRVPVAALLKELLDRAASAGYAWDGGSSGRARRNVDKLLADAHTSGLTSVRAFLEYVRTLRDAGARESEAPTEAGSAVQLMTVHKAKGLEFPVVVIADASHAGGGAAAAILFDDHLGLTVDLRARHDPAAAGGAFDDPPRRTVAHSLAALRDAGRGDAEDRRLLYVAATRAQEKLLVSAHTRILKGGRLGTSGWLGLLAEVTGLDAISLPGTPIDVQELPLCEGVGCRLYPWHEPDAAVAQQAALSGTDAAAAPPADLLPPLVAPWGTVDAGSEPPPRSGRVGEAPAGRRAQPPAQRVDLLVRAALRHWRPVDGQDEQDGKQDEPLASFLRPYALQAGAVDEQELQEAIGAAVRLLRCFRSHPLWAEIDAAQQRWHAVPFSLPRGTDDEGGAGVQDGHIDLLYHSGGVWKAVNFETGRPPAGADLAAYARRRGCEARLRRGLRAARAQLGAAVEGLLVFLDAGGAVGVLEMREPPEGGP